MKAQNSLKAALGKGHASKEEERKFKGGDGHSGIGKKGGILISVCDFKVVKKLLLSRYI